MPTLMRPDSPPTTSVHRRLPSQIGDYRVLERIGKGGRSYVFKARQRLLERTVALKVLRPELARRTRDLIAFKREAGAYGACDHPHILSCYQAGQEGEWHYMALSHAAKGDTIRALQGVSRRQALAQVLGWMSHLAGAVDYLRQQGFVHGDIKPANILVTGDDRALLADLGSLHPLHDDGEPQRFEGTAAYMSPEQARRERIDELTDIYAIGASAWHLLAGRAPRPPCEDKREALRRAAEDALPPLRQVAAWIPSSVAAVIQRCLEPDASHRYQRPSDLAQAAQQVLDCLHGGDSDTWQPVVDLHIGY